MEKHLKSTWQSPSNIAFIKYWGKYGNQLPCNASFSMSLSACYTETTVLLKNKQGEGEIEFDFKFEGQQNPKFAKRIGNYLNKITSELPFILNYHVAIESTNSFPHSAGIASSASAFSALALCLASLQNNLYKACISDKQFFEQVSELARLGSGSASRSVHQGYSIWGKHPNVQNSNTNFAIPYNKKLHPMFNTLHDYILIINNNEKETSSSAGHALMENHPYAKTRYQTAQQNLTDLLTAITQGDFKAFAYILEHEALGLHALMMMAKPWYTLLMPNTLKVLDSIKKFRSGKKVDVAFTLDAGPNVHIIFPENELALVESFIENELKQYCFNGRYIKDKIGQGPKPITMNHELCQ